MKKVIIIDTSILCVWLQVPGKETCGSGDNCIDYPKVKKAINEAIDQKATLVLPLAAIIETGNHIAQAPGDKHIIATAFSNHIISSIDEKSPWAAFSRQTELWEGDQLKKLLENWKKTVNTNHSLGDATIVEVANYYAATFPNSTIEIYTGDSGLKAYQPITKPLLPRRRY